MEQRPSNLRGRRTISDGIDVSRVATALPHGREPARAVERRNTDSANSELPRTNPGGENAENAIATDGAAPEQRTDRYHGLPVVVIRHPDGSTQPAPFLMRQDEVAAFFRLHESNTKFPEKTIQRYRRMGLRTVRVGRRVWFRLDDVLRFLDEQQDRLRWA